MDFTQEMVLLVGRNAIQCIHCLRIDIIAALPLRVPSCTSPSDIEHARDFTRRRSSLHALSIAMMTERITFFNGKPLRRRIVRSRMPAKRSTCEGRVYYKTVPPSLQANATDVRVVVSTARIARKRIFGNPGSLLHSRIASGIVLLRRLTAYQYKPRVPCSNTDP